MKRRKQHRRPFLLMLTVLLAILAVAACYVRLSLAPAIRELAVVRVENEASSLIAQAIDTQIELGTIDYDKIICFDKNEAGMITALKTDMSEINRMKTDILAMINDQILDFDVTELSIPLGNVMLPTLLTGCGPMLPVRVLSIRNSNAEFFSTFSEAGINQTLHQITLQVSIDMTILTPTGTENVNVDSGVVVAETVLVGQVPNSVLQITQAQPNK